MSRWPLIAALALTCAVGAPFLLGDGIDVPDDALYYELASWEWLRLAWLEGRSPWFVPGKLGGVSLFVDTVPMGPFYPATLLALVLPAGRALSLAYLLHALGALLAVRWFARTLGASPAAATLAGAAVSVGPLGTFGFVDARGVAWATLVWLPVALAAFERARTGPKLRWIAVCGAALALILLGSHLRIAAAALAIFGLWALSAGRAAWIGAPALLLGLAAGAPGYLPTLAEWGQASSSAGLGGKLAALATAPESGVTAASLPGLLAPRPWASYADYGLGVVLGAALFVGLDRQHTPPVRRAAGLAAVLYLAAFSPALGPLRWAFSPLLVLTHPVDDVYSALAMIPAAAAAAVCLDGFRADRPFRLARAGLVLVLAFSGAALLTDPSLFRDDDAMHLYRVALLQAAIAIPAALLLLRLGRVRLAVGLGLFELALIALRIHVAVPSAPLPLVDRTDVADVEALADGYLDVDDLARLEAFRYDTEEDEAEAAEPPREFWEDTAETMQAEILHRRWPAHLGVSRGYRGLSGRAKLIPRRQVEALGPLRDELSRRSLDGASLRSLFEDPNQVGARTLALHGIPVAAAPDGSILRVPDTTPPCFTVGSSRAEANADARLQAVLSPGWSAGQAEAILEDPAHVEPHLRQVEVRCDPAGTTVDTEFPALFVVRERFHPGWQIRSAAPLTTFPVNVVHTGVSVPPGQHDISWRFVPPGLRSSLLLAGFGWLLLALLGWRSQVGGVEEAGLP